MLLVSEILQDGMQAYCDANPATRDYIVHACPYVGEITHAGGFHGAKSIGKVRIGIDWQHIWNIGWELGQLIEQQNDRKP